RARRGRSSLAIPAPGSSPSAACGPAQDRSAGRGRSSCAPAPRPSCPCARPAASLSTRSSGHLHLALAQARQRDVQPAYLLAAGDAPLRDVDQPAVVILRWKIGAVVRAATLLTAEGGLGGQPRHLRE